MLLMQLSDGSAIPIAIGTGSFASSLVSEVFWVFKEEGDRVDVLIIHLFFGI